MRGNQCKPLHQVMFSCIDTCALLYLRTCAWLYLRACALLYLRTCALLYLRTCALVGAIPGPSDPSADPPDWSSAQAL